MELVFRILCLFSFIALTNLFGLRPNVGKYEDYKKTASSFNVTILWVYVGVCAIGYFHIIGWLLYFFLFHQF